MILYVNIEYEWFFVRIYLRQFFKKCLIKREQKILEV